LKNIESPARMN